MGRLITRFINFIRCSRKHIYTIRHFRCLIRLITSTTTCILARNARRFTGGHTRIPGLTTRRIMRITLALHMTLCNLNLSAANGTYGNCCRAFLFNLFRGRHRTLVYIDFRCLPHTNIITYLYDRNAPRFITSNIPVAQRRLTSNHDTNTIRATNYLILTTRFLTMLFRTYCGLWFFILGRFCKIFGENWGVSGFSKSSTYRPANVTNMNSAIAISGSASTVTTTLEHFQTTNGLYYP